MTQLYFALVHPSLLYRIIVWGLAFPKYLLKLQILQNKTTRIMTGTHFHETINPIYAKLNILLVDDLYSIKTAKFIFNWSRNKMPSSIFDYFYKIKLNNNSSNKAIEQPEYIMYIVLIDYKGILSTRESRYRITLLRK